MKRVFSITITAALFLAACDDPASRLVKPLAPAHSASRTVVMADGITDLGTLGGNTSLAEGVNDLGQVVGAAQTASGETHAFLWDPTTGTMQDLGTLGGTSSEAHFIDNQGRVVGASTRADNVGRPFIWDAVHGMQEIPGTFGGRNGGEAEGISGNLVVGRLDSYAEGGGDLSQRGFVYDLTTGVLRDLGSINDTYSTATSVNSSGEFVGYSSTGCCYVATVWTSATAPLRQLAVDPAAGGYGVARGITEDGVILGYTNAASNGPDLATRWASADAPPEILLPSGSLGFPGSYAWTGNSAGFVAGALYNSSNFQHAFLWDPTTRTATDLGASIPDRTSMAYRMNNPSQGRPVVVGWATTADNQQHAVIFAGTLPPLAIPLTIDPSTFAGTYEVNGGSAGPPLGYGAGVRTVTLAPGDYSLDFLNSSVTFTVTSTGNVVSASPAVTGGQARLTMNAVHVTIDPADLPLGWFVHDGEFNAVAGRRVVDLPLGSTFGVDVGEGEFLADIDGAGMVTSRDAAAAVGGQNTLTFNTIPVTVDPVAFTSAWQLHNGQLHTGKSVVPLVPNLPYDFFFNDADKARPLFFLDVSGNTKPVGNTGLLGGSRQITFRNVTAHVTTSVAGPEWQLHGGSFIPGAFMGHGDGNLVLIPDVAFVFERNDGAADGGGAFYVGDPCSITPTTFVVHGVTYTIGCGPLDATPPVIQPSISGTLGNSGWYTSAVSLSWTVSDPESPVTAVTGCGPTAILNDQQTAPYTCTATSGGGTTSRTVSVKRDATAPAIAFSGNAGTYTVDQSLSIFCATSDAMSGIASTTCAPVSGPAYGFAIGQNSISATSTDVAGNVATATTTFTVAVTSDGLCSLIGRWVNDDGIANSMCVKVKHDRYTALRNEVAAQRGKAIADADAQTLLRLTAGL